GSRDPHARPATGSSALGRYQASPHRGDSHRRGHARTPRRGAPPRRKKKKTPGPSKRGEPPGGGGERRRYLLPFLATNRILWWSWPSGLIWAASGEPIFGANLNFSESCSGPDRRKIAALRHFGPDWMSAQGRSQPRRSKPHDHACPLRAKGDRAIK